MMEIVNIKKEPSSEEDEGSLSENFSTISAMY